MGRPRKWCRRHCGRRAICNGFCNRCEPTLAEVDALIERQRRRLPKWWKQEPPGQHEAELRKLYRRLAGWKIGRSA